MATGNKQPMVQFKGILKRFGNVVAVEKMDIDIEEGSLVTLLGPSGCGKTTLLRMVAGLEDPTDGDIFIKGVRINDTPIHKRNLGMIFQNYALFPHKNIFDNVAFGLKYRDVSKDDIKKKVTRALEMVRLPGVENRMPAQLSGGQQQRIALARAIARGASDDKGEEVAKRPVHPRDLIRSMYTLLGIDPDGPLPNSRGLDVQVLPIPKDAEQKGGLLTEIL